MQATVPTTTPPETIDALIARLDRGNLRRRTQTEHALIAYGAEAVGPLLARLTKETRARRKNRALRIALTAFAVGFYLWLAPHLTEPIYWPLLFVFLPITLKIMQLNAASRFQIHAAKVLASIDDIRAVGPLAEALEFSDMWTQSGVNRIATRTLTCLLRQLQPADAVLLDARQRACLYRALNAYPHADTDLAYAILDALPILGDQDALAVAERLAERNPVTITQQQLRDHARRILPSLRARVEAERAPHVLLRPAEAVTPPELLLRPAAGIDATEPAQLLRATREE